MESTTTSASAGLTRPELRPASTPAPVAPPPMPAPATNRRLAPRPAGRRMVKRALWTAVAVGLAVALGLALRPHPVGVETAAATRGTLLVTVDEDGRTRVKDRYVVSAPLAGALARVTLRPGDSVEQGQVVARLVPLASPLLDPRSRAEADARVAAARAVLSQSGTSVERARAALEFARRESDRQRTLLSHGATASQIVEQAELAELMREKELASAEFSRRVAASDLRLAQAALARLAVDAISHDQFTLTAPVRGRVLRVLQESEGVVQPGTGLLEIGDPASLEVVADVLTTAAVEIRPGAPVRIERWGGDSALTGHVHRVEPSAFTRLSALGVEEQRVNVVIDLDAPHERWAALGDGYRVEASIAVWQGRDRLLVPGGAVFRQGDGWATYVVEGRRARLRPIAIGRSNGSEVEVLRGLRPADRVVLYPTDNVTDGVRVAER